MKQNHSLYNIHKSDYLCYKW